MTPQSAHQKLVRRLTQLRTQQMIYHALTGVGIALIFTLSAGLCLVVLEVAFYMSPTLKIALESLCVIGLLIILLRFCFLPLANPPKLDSVALYVERHFGGLRQQLISALQLWEQREQQTHSSALVDAAVIRAEQTTAHLAFETLNNRKRPIRAACWAIVIALLGILLHAGWPIALNGATQRLANPQTPYTRPVDTHIVLRPGNIEIVAGEPFEITAQLSGIVPRNARLYVREIDVQTWASYVLPVKQNIASHRFPAVTRSFDYRLIAHDAETPAYQLTVRPRPIVTRIFHTDHFPPYTNLSDRIDSEGGDIVVPVGTKIDLKIEVNQPIERVWLVFDNKIEWPATPSATTATATFTVEQDQRYSVHLRDPFMVTNRDPVEYRIVALPDRPPDVRLLRPGRDTDLGESMRVSLVAEAFDDYGISRLEVRYHLSDEDEDRILPITMKPNREITAAHNWDLSNLNLLPGDQITYRMRAYDNNPTPSFGETASYTVRFPSLFEIHQAADKTQRESLEKMEAVQERGRELDERLSDLARDLLAKDELDWQEKREVEKALETQKHLTEQIESTAEQLEEALDRLEESGLLEDDTLQKLDELQKLLSQIQTPELKEAMEKLDEAAKNANPDLVREALEQFQTEREKFRRAIERTIALLERVRQQQTLDALSQKLEQLAREQNQITRDIDRETPTEDLARREELIARDTDQLRDELERAANQMDSPTDRELEQLADAIAERDLANRMDQVRRNLSAGQQQQAGVGSESISKDLNELSRQLAQIRQQFLQRQKDQIARELNRVLHDLLTLSQAQERTAQKADSVQNRADTIPLTLDQARTISGASRMAERLLDASQKTFFMPPSAGAALGNALKKMEGAAELLNSGNSNSAAKLAREAMGALNNAAMMVQRALRQLAASESGTGFEEMMQQMSQLAQQQGNLNAQTESLFGQPQPGQNGQPSWQKLAAQQRAIREALNALRNEMARQQREALGDLGQIAGNMQKTAEELNKRRPTPEILKRQRQILSRLLDAQQSMRERGKSRKRQARAGENVAYKGPGSLPSDFGEADNPLHRHLRDALKEGYSAEYQALIRQYFEALIEDAQREQNSNE
jgi:hypothetical protein